MAMAILRSQERDFLERAKSRIGNSLCNKYHIDDVLGVGGTATVYATTHRNRRRFAVKVLHPELSYDMDIRSRFVREGFIANYQVIEDNRQGKIKVYLKYLADILQF